LSINLLYMVHDDKSVSSRYLLIYLLGLTFTHANASQDIGT